MKKVTYDFFRWGCSKSTPIQCLLPDINLFELELNCFLQVIHVPSTSMFIQGTDGVSRGANIQVMGSHKSNRLVPLLWKVATATSKILQWTTYAVPSLCPPSTTWLIQANFSD